MLLIHLDDAFGCLDEPLHLLVYYFHNIVWYTFAIQVIHQLLYLLLLLITLI